MQTDTTEASPKKASKKKKTAKKAKKSVASKRTNEVVAEEDGKKVVRSTKKGAILATKLQEKFGDGFVNVVVDPDAPLQTARGYINMASWWEELTDVPGIPLGHVVVIQGKPDCGKTTIAMEGMIQAQGQNFDYVILLDSEYKFNLKRFDRMGGDVEDLMTTTAGTIEEVFSKFNAIMDTILEEEPQAKVLFVWDSLGMTPTEAEAAADEYDQQPALAARVVRKMFRRCISKIHQHNIAFVVVNHVYQNIKAKFGESTKGYGGSGAYYSAVIVIEVEKIGSLKRQKNKVVFKYLRVKLKVKKNHLSGHQGTEKVVNLLPMGIETKGSNDKDDEMIYDTPVPKSVAKKRAQKVNEHTDDDLDIDEEDL